MDWRFFSLAAQKFGVRRKKKGKDASQKREEQQRAATQQVTELDLEGD